MDNYFRKKEKETKQLPFLWKRPKAHGPPRRPFMDWGAQRALDVNEYTIHTTSYSVALVSNK